MEENKIKAKKHSSGGRFNVLDLIIIVTAILLIAVCIVLAVPRIQRLFTNEDTVQITYTVVFENVDESVYDLIMLDQPIVDMESGRSLGTVTMTPETVSYYELVLGQDADGNPVAKKLSMDELGKNITVTVRAEATYSEGKGYTVNGYRIAAGAEMQLRFPDFVGTGYCNGLSVIG